MKKKFYTIAIIMAITVPVSFGGYYEFMSSEDTNKPEIIIAAPNQPTAHKTENYSTQNSNVETNAQKTTQSYYDTSTPTTQNSKNIYENDGYQLKVDMNTEKMPYYTNWSDVQATDIVTTVGNKLKRSNGLTLKVQYQVVNDEEVNACTDIENNIYVFKGILPYIENEDELAFIIGHEMGHATSKHVLKSVVTNTTAGTANQVGKKVAAGALKNVLNNSVGRLGYGVGSAISDTAVGATNYGIDAATVATTSTMQRGRENNADLLAIDYLVKAGYNPLAGISIMNKIGDNYPDLFEDHPSTDKRVVTMYEYVKKTYPSYISKGFNTESYTKAIKEYVKNK